MAVFRLDMFWVFFFLYFSSLHGIHGTDPQESDEKFISNMKKVKDKIFKNYDKDVRPESHHNHTTSVEFCVIPMYFIELDEEKSLFNLDSWLVLMWQDKRLRWNSSEFEGIKRISVPDNAVWQPDIRVYNGHSSKVDPMKNVPLHVMSSGTIFWVPKAGVEAFCDVTTPIGSYPHDTHICNVTYGSWSHDGWQIDINLHLSDKKIHWDLFSNTNPRWEVDIERSKMFKVVRKYECCEEPYVSIDAQFTLKRRLPTEMRIAWVFSTLVMILTLAMFWIPSYSGKKIILGGSLLAILIVSTIYCASVTSSPRAPQLAVSFVQSTMIAVTTAVLLEVIIIKLSRISGPRKPPEFLMQHLSGSLSSYMCIILPWKQYNVGDKVRLHENTEETSTDPTIQQEWLVIATSLDRILFIVYIVIFAVLQV